jgi:hypothetical protein
MTNKQLGKWFLYIGLAGIKAFMSALMVAMVFFVEVFFINKYVDPTLAEGIMPVVELARTHWTWIFWAVFVFEIIVNFNTINNSNKK